MPPTLPQADFEALIRRAGLTLSPEQVAELYHGWEIHRADAPAHPRPWSRPRSRARPHLPPGTLVMQTPTIAEAARLFASRDLSPVELTRHCLDRIAAEDGALNSFLLVTPDRALADARAAEARIMSGRPARQARRHPDRPQGHLRHRRDPHHRPLQAAAGLGSRRPTPPPSASSPRLAPSCSASSPPTSLPSVAQASTSPGRPPATRGTPIISPPAPPPALARPSPPG